MKSPDKHPDFCQEQKINRRSFEPAYIQLADILCRQIAGGIYRAGDQLPSEAQLCSQYGVSPMTVRRVINTLAEKGLVTAYQGRGTFVKPLSLSEANFRLEELKDHLSGQQDTSVLLLEARVLAAEERVARKLGIEVGKHAVYIRRLVMQKDAPIMYHRDYLIYDPKRPIVEAELTITSLEGLLKGGPSDRLRYGELSIEPVALRDEEAALLKVPVGTAAFSLEHIFFDFDASPVSWGWFICRADHLKLSTRIGADVDL